MGFFSRSIINFLHYFLHLPAKIAHGLVNIIIYTPRALTLTPPSQDSTCTRYINNNTRIGREIFAMEGVEHRFVTVNGINMHVAEMGPVNGPVILFLHGFPELWYAWRHQIAAMASLGYRAVAPDLRGYGDTDAPADVGSYTAFHVVGDLVALLDVVAPNQEKVFVVSHDWGSYMAWYLCLFRPDRVKALLALSVSFSPRNPKAKPVDSVRAINGNDFYICSFQEPGVAEGVFGQYGEERVLKEFLTYHSPAPLYLPKDKGFGPKDETIVLPSWLTEEDVKFYSSKFQKTGFTGGLNYYRNMNRNWELTAPWTGAKIRVPVKFVAGDEDLSYTALGAKQYIAAGGLKRDVPLLEEVVIMEGVGHFIQEEKPGEVNQHIHDFFKKF